MFSGIRKLLLTPHFGKASLFQPILKKSLSTTQEKLSEKIKELELTKKIADKQSFQDCIASTLFLGTGFAGIAGGVKASLIVADFGPSLPITYLSLSVLTVSIVSSIHFGGKLSNAFLKDAMIAHKKSKDIKHQMTELTNQK